jgi:hypothetical protein
VVGRRRRREGGERRREGRRKKEEEGRKQGRRRRTHIQGSLSESPSLDRLRSLERPGANTPVP